LVFVCVVCLRARVARLQPGDDPQQRRLAAAGRSQESGQLPGRQGDVDVLERDEVAAAPVDVLDLDTHEADSLGRNRETTRMHRTLIRTRMNDTAYASPWAKLLYFCSTTNGAVWV